MYEYEERWRNRWEADGLWHVDVEHARDVFYNLVEFPYPSADGLHVGSVRTYSGADAYGRYQRMRGRTVFQPMGFDSFGINAENFALKTGEHPRRLIERTVPRFRGQLERIGAAWDWSHTLTTSDPSYYRWTQWIFTRLFRAGLAYRAEAPVVWCPSCLTVLAFEQLEGDNCERCGTPVTERVMRQWFVRITAYADALVDGLDALDWPDWAKRQQREWIGRSAGAEIDFEVPGRETLTVFTTRPDTLPGVTFLAVAPEGRGLGDRFKRTSEGFDTGRRAIHPTTGARLPIWVADYVVAEYGTGVVMGVPAHDERDRAFALEHGLPIGDGRLEPVGPRRASAPWGRPAVRYRLRDWLISRQRYWGTPIPIVHCARCGEVPVPDDQLPVLLPDIEDVRPTGTGRSPLAAAPWFVRTSCPVCGGDAERETDVADTFVESAWYYLRYPCTDLHDAPWSIDRIERMLPVDQYEGGREHVTRHHLYARFTAHALHDLGLLPFREPFPRMSFHGLIVHEGAKMSKSRGNVVEPDEYVDRVGADNLRLALLFCGPWETPGEFSDDHVGGMVRFTERIKRLAASPGEGVADTRILHRTIDKVTRDIEAYRFNTAIAALMECVRWAMHVRPGADVVRTIVLLLAPFAPHLAEELWSRLGGEYSVHQQAWPEPDPALLVEETVEVVVQVNGRVRDVICVSRDATEDEVRAAALSSSKVLRALEGRLPERVIYVQGRVVNFKT